MRRARLEGALAVGLSGILLTVPLTLMAAGAVWARLQAPVEAARLTFRAPVLRGTLSRYFLALPLSP